jgi:phosphatidylglycerophosphate synthase
MGKPIPRYLKAYEPWRTIFFTDVVAIPVARLLAGLKVNSNLLTVISLFMGLVPGIMFALGHWVWAAIIFEAAFFLDCLDGKVARMRQMTSPFGAKLDVFSEMPRKPACFIGILLYFHFAGETLLVWFTVGAIIVHYAVHKLYTAAGVSQYDLEFPRFQRNIVRGIVPRMLNFYNWFEEELLEFEVFPLIGGLLGMPNGRVWFLYGAGFVTVLGLLKFINSLYYRLTGKYDEIYQDWAGTKGNLDKVKSGTV